MSAIDTTLDIRCASLDELMHLWCYANMPTSLSVGDENDLWLPPHVRSIDLKLQEEVQTETKTYGDVFCGEKVGDIGDTVPKESVFYGRPNLEVVAVVITDNHSLVKVVETKQTDLQAKTLLYGLKQKGVIKKADLRKNDGEWRNRHAKALESRLSF